MATMFRGTTEVPAEKSANQIMAILVRIGAREIMHIFNPDGSLRGLAFRVPGKDGTTQPYQLPAFIDVIFKRINSKRNYPGDFHVKDRQQATRVAWRQLLAWVEAQAAMIENGMAKTDEIFMPYMVGPDGRTLYQIACEIGMQKMLPALPKVD